MPKVGSRSIVVDGQRYRWRVRRSPTHMQSDYGTALTFSVQHEDGGSTLLVVANGPRQDNWRSRDGTVITPAVVMATIRKAIASGWKPTESGPAFRMAMDAEA